MNKPRIAVVHPWLRPGGGSEAVAMWLIQALQEDHNVTLITRGTSTLEELNACYGTKVSGDLVSVRSLPLPRFFPSLFAAWRDSSFQAFCRREAPKYDLMISAYGVMDFGRPGIQIIGDFSFDDELRRDFGESPQSWTGIFYRESLSRRIYLGIGRLLSGASEKGWRRNLTLANSLWSRNILREKFSLDSKVVYPPVPLPPQGLSWKDRENGFVYLGRISPEKGIERMISILEKARHFRPDLHFHLMGRADDPSYSQHLDDLIARSGEWIRREGPVFGEAKWDLLGRHKFGIFGRENEPFGIAVAETIGSGCIVWVPAGGGQVEIVSHPELIYGNEVQAVEQIKKVMNDETLQASIRESLIEKSGCFSTDRFMAEMRETVSMMLKGKA